MSLSKREKILLFITAVLIVGFLAIRFAVIPAYRHYNIVLEEHFNLSYEMEMMKMKIAEEETALKMLAEATLLFEEVKEKYPILLPNEEIDRILTGICVDSGMNPMSLSISDYVVFVPPGPEGEETPGEIEDEDEAVYALSTVAAQMTARGTYDSLKNFIDRTDNIDYIDIKNLSFTHPRERDRGLPGVTLSLELTMINESI